MVFQATPPQNIIVLAYPGTQGGPEQAGMIGAYLQQAGVLHVEWGSFLDRELIQRVENGEFALMVALGGDGTMLRAGHLCAPLGIPFLGINLGRFGFLTEIQRGEWRDGLSRLVEGRFRLEERMLLRAEHWRREKTLGNWLVINEVVVCRGQFVRPIRVTACVDGYPLTTYVADGVIAATPTGSTAYALAAGGPIMPPDLRNILIIPVAPHLTMDRAIILSEGARVDLQHLHRPRSGDEHRRSPAPAAAGRRRGAGGSQRPRRALRALSGPRLFLPQHHHLYGAEPLRRSPLMAQSASDPAALTVIATRTARPGCAARAASAPSAASAPC